MTNVWFVRSNGPTSHNDPATDNYVAGEPPNHPETQFNYRTKCITDGFARIGWPNTGDLHAGGAGRLAAAGYSLADCTGDKGRHLTEFASIKTGDLILIPADRQTHDVHLGRVVRRSAPASAVLSMRAGVPAYYYFHRVADGEWYECAHRIDVLWDYETDLTPGIHNFPDLGGIWRQPFSVVNKAKDAVIQAAKASGLLHNAD